jgi:hypothetical protein
MNMDQVVSLSRLIADLYAQVYLLIEKNKQLEAKIVELEQVSSNGSQEMHFADS